MNPPDGQSPAMVAGAEQSPKRPVVVGYDRSPASLAAIATGSCEAKALGVPLRIVHAYVWPVLYASLANTPLRPDSWQAPEPILAEVSEVAASAAAQCPGLRVEFDVIAGAAGPVLVEESRNAALLLVGKRGIGGITGLLAGAVATTVAAKAHCPAIVVGRADSAGGAAVVAGVDGTPSSLDALRFAGRWAARHKAPLRAIYAIGDGPELPARDHLDDWLSPIRVLHPELSISPEVVRGPAGDELMAASRTATIVVVGSRERGELLSTAFGSVGYRLIRSAPCPVAVVHGADALCATSVEPVATSHAQ
jgi:nucleotide-binding universal stress UspA family protein